MSTAQRARLFCYVAALLTISTNIAFAQNLPSEPDPERLVNEDVNVVSGLYIREYSLSGNGIVDFKTARQIIQAEQNAFGNTVVETLPHPLFYWYDEQDNGDFHMWIDQKGEGCRCDIVPYVASAAE
ncbi:MAG TPA: hypothetical protein VFQ34_07875 [Nitrospiraceae bacterium]|jgi:hypothetical protein|nr:hypothetical protein [Nitrospiraceae bacterium]